MKAAPHSLILAAVRFDVFGTLTYRNVPGRVETVVAHGLEWLERVRRFLRLQINDYYWFLRPEAGETHGRFHLHCLIRVHRSKFGYFFPGTGRLSGAHRAWGRGMTKFRKIESEFDPAIEYVQKDCETCLADAYELNKTGEARRGIPSLALRRRKAGQAPCLGGNARKAGTVPPMSALGALESNDRLRPLGRGLAVE